MNAESLSQFLLTLGRISAQAGVLVLIVLALRWLLGDRLTPRWRCALWLLVAARLLLPVSFGSAVSLFNLLPRWQRPVESAAATMAVRAEASERTAASESAARDPGSSRREEAPNNSEIRNPKAETEASLLTSAAAIEGRESSPTRELGKINLPIGPDARKHVPTAAVLFGVWLMGVVMLGVWLVISSWRTHRSLRRLTRGEAPVSGAMAGASPATPKGVDDSHTVSPLAGRLTGEGTGQNTRGRVSSPDLDSLLDACRAQLGVRTRLTVVECEGLSSPALYGLFRPRLLLPRGFADKFSPEELRFVFLHELAHIQRRDLLVNWLVALLQIAHWFNPLLWLGFACWRADRELACDALVLETAGADQSEDYGRTILRLLEGFTHRAAAPGLVGILEDKRRLRQRIAMIARFVPTRRWSPLAILLVLALAVVGLTDAQGPKPTAEIVLKNSSIPITPTRQQTLATNAENSGIDWLLRSALVVVGQVEAEPQAEVRGTVWRYHCPFKVAEVLKGKVETGDTIDALIFHAGSEGTAPVVKGEKLIFFLRKGGTEDAPVFSIDDFTQSVQPANTDLIAWLKKYLAAGPLRPFGGRLSTAAVPRTELNVRITATTNIIVPFSMRFTNGRADALVLPIRIENRTSNTITASIPHEWYGGLASFTDLGAAVRRMDDPDGWWLPHAVYLLGEIGTRTEPTTWSPGESREFQIRLNWPGAGGFDGALPMIRADATGKYTVRVSLVFKVGDHSEFVVSPDMEIEVRAKAPESAQSVMPADSGLGQPANTLKPEQIPAKWHSAMAFTYKEDNHEAPGRTFQVNSDGTAQLATPDWGQGSSARINPAGTNSVRLDPQQLDRLASLLRSHQAALTSLAPNFPIDGGGSVFVRVTSGEASLAGRITGENQERAFRSSLQGFMAEVGVTATQAAKPEQEAAARKEATVANAATRVTEEPGAPFRLNPTGGRAVNPQPTSLDLRIRLLTNSITPVSRRLTNGEREVLELPVRIENRSAQTITANIAHEWFGGEWPPTDLGAAVRRVDAGAERWRASEVYLSGELGSLKAMTEWLPGQSHEFVLRMNWPGTGSQQSTPLIRADAPGKYAVRVSLVFKVGAHSEFVLSPDMEIDVQAKATESAEAAPPLSQDTLRSWLSQSDLVVRGKVADIPTVINYDPSVLYYLCQFSVSEVFKGTVSPDVTIGIRIERFSTRRQLEFKQGDELILFLKRTGPNGKPDWRTTDIQFGAHRLEADLATELRRLTTSALRPTQSEPKTAASELPPTNALRSLIVFERTVFKQGEPIEAKVFVKNVSDQPVRYDARNADSNWSLLGPDGKPVPNIGRTYFQTIVGYVNRNADGSLNMKGPEQEKYDYPTLKAGEEVEAAVVRIDPLRFYIGKPGKHQFAWEGTQVWGANLAMDPQQITEAEKLAVGLPHGEPVAIEVVRAPGTYGDVLGRILETLPPGWKIEGSDLVSDSIQPEGWRKGHGSRLHLIRAYRPPGHVPSLQLYVMSERVAENPAVRAGDTERAQYLGQSPFGHVYVALGQDEVFPGTGREDRNPLTCWSHAAYDLAVALEVAEPMVKKPAGPDWGRLVSSIILHGIVEGEPPGSIFGGFCANAELSTGEDGKPRILFESNFAGYSMTSASRRKEADKPYYRVSLSIQPRFKRGDYQQAVPARAPKRRQMTGADLTQWWTFDGSVRTYIVNRFPAEIQIEVASDDEEFAKRLNGILDREISAVLNSPGAASNRVADGTELVPELGALRTKLKALVQQYYPKAIMYPAPNLGFEYSVTDFEYTDRDFTEHGPKSNGILCSVSPSKGRPKASGGPLVLPPFPPEGKVIDLIHFKQLLMTSYSSKLDLHLGISLSYPSAGSEEFLKQFRQILAEFEKAE